MKHLFLYLLPLLLFGSVSGQEPSLVNSDTLETELEGKVDFDSAEAARALRTGKESRTPKVFIVFVDDDSPSSAYTELYPILSNDSTAITGMGLTPATYDPVPGVVAVITKEVADDTYSGGLTKAQALEMEADGWEMASHATVSGDLTGVSLAVAEARLATSQEILQSQGLMGKNFVWPNGGNNADLRAICSKYYRSARGVGGNNISSRNIAPFSQYAFAGWGGFGIYYSTDGSNDYDDLADYKELTDRALAHGNGEMICWMLHTGTAFSSTQQQYLIDYIAWVQAKDEYASGDIVFATIDGALDEMETVASGGEADGTGGTYRLGTSLTTDPASRKGWALSRNGSFDLPNAGNVVKLAENAVNLADTPEDFALYKVSVCPLLNQGDSWPHRDDGTVITYNLSSDDTIAYQEFSPLGQTYYFRRYWDGAAWSDWAVMDPEIGIRRLASLDTSIEWSEIAAHDSATKTVTISGVYVGTTTTVPGDTVIATPARQPTDGFIWHAWVYDTDTVAIRMHNISSAAATPSTRNWRFDVLRNLSLGADH